MRSTMDIYRRWLIPTVDIETFLHHGSFTRRENINLEKSNYQKNVIGQDLGTNDNSKN